MRFESSLVSIDRAGNRQDRPRIQALLETIKDLLDILAKESRVMNII